MRVVCKANTAKVLSAKYLNTHPGTTERTVFHVSIGREYQVFAIVLWQSVVLLLLLDDTNLPNVYPVEMFSVIDPRLPDDWFFSMNVANENGVEAIWGYERLACNDAHYEGLLEREPDALKIFFEERWRTEAGEAR